MSDKEQDVEPWVRRVDYDWMVGDRDTWETEANNWKQHAQLLTADNCRLVDQRNAALADVERLTTERDNWQQRAEALEQAAQRLTVENEGLRADALANAPQRIDFQQYCSLKADHEQQAAAIEALQEALKRTEAILEESQDKGATLMRGAESDHQIILGLQECLERSDKRLSQAKARQIPPALVGLLGVIRREAAAAEKMIL